MSHALANAATDVAYKTIAIDGIDIFYREAGPADAPTVLLLHGWPSSSHMFRDLIPKLADRFHVVAPDYPGFGFSAQPNVREFTYSFDRIAALVTRLSMPSGSVSFRCTSKITVARSACGSLRSALS